MPKLLSKPSLHVFVCLLLIACGGDDPQPAASQPESAQAPQQSTRDRRAETEAVTTPRAARPAVIDRTTFEAALARSQPASGAIVTGTTTVVGWSPAGLVGAFTWSVRHRERGAKAWKTVDGGDAPPLRHLQLTGLKDGVTYEYQIVVRVDGQTIEGPIRVFTAATGVHFSERTRRVTIARDYEQRTAIAIANPTDRSCTVALTVDVAPPDLPLGFVGRSTDVSSVTLPANGSVRVPLALFAQDAPPGRHRCVIALRTKGDGQAAGDRVTLEIDVAAPVFDVAVTTAEPAPTTLATPLVVSNKGQTLTDLAIVAVGENAHRVRCVPSVTHARLLAKDAITSTVIPLLRPGERELACEFEIRAAGRSKRVPVTFTVPDDKRVYIALTHSTATSEGENWHCTNRPKVEDELPGTGNGPKGGADSDGSENPDDGPGDDLGPQWARSHDTPGLLFTDEGEPAYDGDYLDGLKSNGRWDEVRSLENAYDNARESYRDNLSAWSKGRECVQGAIRKGRKLLKKEQTGESSATSGFRGGVVRASVAACYPELEVDNYRSPHILVKPDGSAALVWHCMDGKNQEVAYIGWHADGAKRGPINLSDAPGSSRWPTVDGDPAGILVAAWEDDRDGQAMEIYLRRSLDGGASWQAAQRLTEHGQGAFDPILWRHGTTWAIAWEDARGGIYIRRSEDDGVTWLPEIRVTDGKAAWPQLAGTPDNLWCAWELDTGESERIYVTRSTDGGKTWAEPDDYRSHWKTTHNGEPALAVTDGRCYLAWRTGQGDASEISFAACVEGEWTGITSITDDKVFSEYPTLMANGDHMICTYVSEAYGVATPYMRESTDGGRTWGEARREARYAGNVSATLLTVNFGLPYDRSTYKKHDTTIRINGHTVARLEDTIPEGRYVLPVDPRFLAYRPGGISTNRIVFDTVHLNGGHYLITTNFKLIQFLGYQERPIVAASQAEADKLAQAEYGSHVNHDRPDAAIYANLIEGLPEDTTTAQTITLRVPVMNVGPVPLRGATVLCLRDNVERDQLAPAQRIETPIAPRERASVTFTLEHDGKPLRVLLRVDTDGPDACWDNSRHMMTLGKPGPGRVEVIADGDATYTVAEPHDGTPVLTLEAGTPTELPPGPYDLRDAAGTVVHPVFGVRSDETTQLDLAGMGTVTVRTPETAELTFTGEAAELTAKSNAPVRLPPGYYRVDGGDELIVPPITVRRAQSRTVVADAAGWIEADGFHDRIMYRRLRAFDVHGVEVGSTLGTSLKLRPGTYTLRKQHAWLADVAVKAGETTTVTLKHAGGIEVTCDLPKAGDHLFKVYNTAGEKVGEIFIGYMLALPVGTYTVKVLGQTFNDITVAEDKATKIPLERLGCLSIKVPWSRVKVVDAQEQVVYDNYGSPPLHLPAGTYTVTCRKDGKTLGTVTAVTVTAGETTHVTIPATSDAVDNPEPEEAKP